MKKNKFKLTLIITIFLLFSIFLISIITAGEIALVIYSPFGNVASNETVTYSSQLVESELSDKGSRILNVNPNIAVTKFAEIDDYGNDDSIVKPFCQVGGQYFVKVHNDAGMGSKTGRGMYDVIDYYYSTEFNLFYCYTTKDFLNKIQIPTSWKDSNLIVYCNDGNNINVKSTNFDLFTTKINTYKACIVKNLDLNSDNTILYGMEVGNKDVDSDKVYFYNDTTKTGPALTEFTILENEDIFIDKDEREFKLDYIDENKIFIIADLNTDSDYSIPLTSVFNIDDLEISRVAFFKKINNKMISGYETVTKKATDLEEFENSLKTVYTIKLEGFDFNAEVCKEVLAQYETFSNSVIKPNYDIICTGDVIQIISQSLDDEKGRSKSFHVFKNIILSLE